MTCGISVDFRLVWILLTYLLFLYLFNQFATRLLCLTYFLTVVTNIFPSLCIPHTCEAFAQVWVTEIFLFSFPIGCLVVTHSVSFVSSPSSLPFHPKLVTADGCPCSKGVFPPHFHQVLAYRRSSDFWVFFLLSYNIKHIEATIVIIWYKLIWISPPAHPCYLGHLTLVHHQQHRDSVRIQSFLQLLSANFLSLSWVNWHRAVK